MFLNDVFEIANALLTDKNDLAQKGCGWMLKAAGEADAGGVQKCGSAKSKSAGENNMAKFLIM